MGFCKCLVGSLCCVGLLAMTGALTWRYGPWYDESVDPLKGINIGGGSSSNDDLTEPSALAAKDACPTCCNTLTSNCGLPVNQVLFPMVHNAMSSYGDYFLSANNNLPMEKALVAGYRGLMLDSCICESSTVNDIKGFLGGQDNTGLRFCHKTCDAGARKPDKLLGNLKTFLEVNPNEVVIVEFEVNDNSLNDLFYAIDDSGLDEYIYSPADKINVEWPTMQELIDANTRLIIFAHGDGIESCAVSNCPEGFLYTFDHLTQTNWNDESCDIKGNDVEPRAFFLMNHWMNNDLDLPSEDNAQEFNAFAKLIERTEKCSGRIPNIIAVDFWDVGDVLPFVKEVNTQRAG